MSFVKEAGQLITGTTLSQLLLIAASPFLSRLYNPEAFGYFAIYSVLTMILGTISMGKFEVAQMVPQNRKDVKGLMTLGVMWSIGLAILFALICEGLYVLDVHMPHVEFRKYNFIFVIVSFETVVSALREGMNVWFTKFANYRKVAFFRVVQALTTVTVSLTLGFLQFEKIGLILGSFVGVSIATIWMFFSLKKEMRQLHQEKSVLLWDRKALVSLFHHYSHFPRYHLPSNFIEKFSSLAPSLFFAGLFDASALGFYNLAQRIVQLPTKVVSKAVSDVFLQRLTQIQQTQDNEAFVQKEQRRLFGMMFRNMSKMAAFPYGLGAILSPWIFPLIFGAEWATSGKIASILCALSFFEFVALPMSHVFVVKNRLKWSFLVNLGLGCGLTAAVFLGWWQFHEFLPTIVLYSSVFAIKYLIDFTLCFSFLKSSK